MDSLTRFARAYREIALQSGERPARQGFPASVFEAIPRLVERTGNDSRGSITAIFTVLTDDNPANDMMANEIKSLLDGHIILSQEKAERGEYPAVDILASRSRTMPLVTVEDHQRDANALRALEAKYRQIELLVQVGEYVAGTDPMADRALEKRSAIQAFLNQDARHSAPFESMRRELAEIAR